MDDSQRYEELAVYQALGEVLLKISRDKKSGKPAEETISEVVKWIFKRRSIAFKVYEEG